ncbi:MAG: RNA-binding S4 domain-containing protein [Deltaproteobacteria bacterium]|nr:RNA-binding S4 domain-containing protein [Deltaproteobacteria bacterium]
MSEPDSLAPQPVRADRWLWAARFFKTRSQAAAACHAGHVKLGGQSIKAAKLLHPGDRIELATPRGQRQIEVVSLHDRRGPPALARTLYEDHTPPAPTPPPAGARDRGAGRPSKRERRDLRKLRGR